MLRFDITIDEISLLCTVLVIVVFTTHQWWWAVLTGVGRRVGTASATALFGLSYCLCGVGRTVKRMLAALVASPCSDVPTDEEVDLVPGQVGYTRNLYPRIPHASWVIVEEVGLLTRAQCGFTRYTDPNDQATAALVKKVAWGIISDKKRFPDLRDTDAAKLMHLAAGLALYPCFEETVDLDIRATRAIQHRTRRLLAHRRRMPYTFFERVLAGLGLWAGEVVVPAAQPSQSF